MAYGKNEKAPVSSHGAFIFMSAAIGSRFRAP